MKKTIFFKISYVLSNSVPWASPPDVSPLPPPMLYPPKASSSFPLPPPILVRPTVDPETKKYMKISNSTLFASTRKNVENSISIKAYQFFYRSVKLPLYFEPIFLHHLDNSFLENLCSISCNQVFACMCQVNSKSDMPLCTFVRPLFLNPLYRSNFLRSQRRMLVY